MRKKILIVGLGVAATAAVAVMLRVPETPTPLVHEPQLPHTGDSPLVLTLPVRQSLGAPQVELFASPKAPPKPVPVETAALPPPSPPPMPYRVAGQVIHDGKPGVVLAKGDRLLMVEQGDVVDGGYRVASIEATRVTLVYLPLNATEHLTTNLTLPAGPVMAVLKTPKPSSEPIGDLPPAQLRWEGPERVQAGSPFQLVLKLNSAQPIHASPVRLTYDPKVLEPVAVNAGELFTHGTVSYRVGANGSIFVSAPGGGALIEEADFLVLTFRPTRPTPGAQVSLSAAEFKGLGGQPIAYEPPSTFRTTVQR